MFAKIVELVDNDKRTLNELLFGVEHCIILNHFFTLKNVNIISTTTKAPLNENLILLILAIIQFAHILDFMIIMPLGAQFMEYFSIEPAQFTFIVSVYAFSSFIAGLFGSMFLDRFDRRTAMLFLVTGFTVGTFACSIADTYILFLLARGMAGAFGGLIGALALSIIGDVFPYERRSRATGVLMTAFSVASIVGVPAGVFIAGAYGWQMSFVTVGCLALIALLVIPKGIPSLRDHIAKEKPNPLLPIRDALTISRQRGALFFNFILILGHFSIIPLLATFLQYNLGFKEWDIGLMYMVGGVVSFIALPQIGKLADRYGNKRIFTIFSIGAIVSTLLITGLGDVGVFWGIATVATLFAVNGGRTVPALTLTTAVVSPNKRGGFMSLRTSVNEAALGIGSLISGYIVVQDELSQRLFFYERVGYFAVALGAIAMLLAWRLKTIEGNES